MMDQKIIQFSVTKIILNAILLIETFLNTNDKQWQIRCNIIDDRY